MKESDIENISPSTQVTQKVQSSKNELKLLAENEDLKQQILKLHNVLTRYGIADEKESALFTSQSKPSENNSPLKFKEMVCEPL